MYNRKIKVSKKKTKSAVNNGSKWGPRLALYEREQATQHVQKLLPPQQLHHNNHHVGAPASISNSAIYGHHYSQNKSQQHYNHYQHRPQAQIQSNRNNDSGSPGPSVGGHNAGVHDGSYNFYGSSSVSSSNLHNRETVGGTIISTAPPPTTATTTTTTTTTKLSSHPNNSNLSKPLSVIIPPPDRFNLNSDFGPDRDSSVPSTKTWRSSPELEDHQHHDHQHQHQTHHIDDDDLDETRTRTTTYDNRHGIPPPPQFNVKPTCQNSHNHHHIKKKTSIYEQQVEQETMMTNGKHVKSKVNKELDTPVSKSSHYQSKPSSSRGLVSTGAVQDELQQEQCESEGVPKSKVNGSAIAALAQGMTMVYVPMEAATRNVRNKLRAAVSNGAGGTKSSEQQAVENLQAKIDENNKICSGHSHNPILQNQHHQQHKSGSLQLQQQNDESKDPDADSLLESFDSVIFKPKTIMMSNGQPNHVCHTSNGGGITNDNKSKDPLLEGRGGGEKIYTSSGPAVPSRRKQQISESPPPLPPPNKPKKPDKNLRFSEQLENFQNSFEKVVKPRLGKKVAIPITPDMHHGNGSHSGSGHSTQHSHSHSQQDTQSVTTEVIDMNKHCGNNNSQKNSSENSFPSTILSCGHMRSSSSYSTLSSVTSTLTGDEAENCTRDPRTALEQLRDLSLLIGGNFHSSSSAPSNNNLHKIGNNRNASVDHDLKSNSNNSQLLKKDGKTRRDSEGSSGIDSGQGSGQSPTEEGKTSTNGSYPSSCAFSNRGDCEDCLMVFRNPLAVDSNSNSGSCSGSGSQSTSASPAQSDRCESHHRHLIIHDQSRMKQSNGKNRSIINHQQDNHSNGRSHHHHGSKKSSKKSKKHKKNHDELVLEYCDCSQCDCETSRRDTKQQHLQINLTQENFHNNLIGNHGSSKIKTTNSCPNELLSKTNGTNSTPINNNSNNNHGNDDHNGNQMSVNHPNHNNHRLNKRTCSGSTSTTSMETHSHPQHQNNSGSTTTNLFTIDEEEVGDVVVPGDGSDDLDFNTSNQSRFMDVSIKEFNHDEGKDHWHPKCWLASDQNFGWSDLESLYSQNMKLDKPININDECWTCWKDVAENRRNATNPNGTVDRTARMFIWLNKRHKEFNAPWWEAKKQASIRWLVTKAFAHVPKESIGDPFKESKKGKAKYRLKDEVIKGLVNGKLYCMALDHCGNLSSVYSQQNQHYRSRGLTHWDIIKILSRRGVYVAQPSDMKLTEGTLRQKPLRIAAHVALMEAIMGLYCKEILNRDRIVATLNSFGQTIDPETNASAEQLLISWINAAILTLKSYIMSNKNQNQKLPCGLLINRWLHIPQVHEIRDLCDGVGICSLFALYCSNDVQVSEIAVPEPDDMLNIYETIENHSLIEKLCSRLFPEKVYHLCITDFLYIHGYMKQNILAFLVDLFNHLEINPIIRVNRLTHVPIRVEL